MEATPMEKAISRVQIHLDAIHRTAVVMARPESASVLIRTSWHLVDQDLAMDRLITLDTLNEVDDMTLRLNLRGMLDLVDKILLPQAVAAVVVRARALEMSYGRLFEKVTL